MNQKYRNYRTGVNEKIMDFYFAKYGDDLIESNNFVGAIDSVFITKPYYYIVTYTADHIGKWLYWIDDSFHNEQETLKWINLIAFL